MFDNHCDISSSDDFKMSGDQKAPTAISLQSSLTDTPTRFEFGFSQPMVKLLSKITTLIFYYFIYGHVLLMFGIFATVDLYKTSLCRSILWPFLNLWTSNSGLSFTQ